jgi:hypothetical protein
MPNFGARASESTLCDAAAAVAFQLQRQLNRLPTEKEVRPETKKYLAWKHAQVVQFTKLRRESEQGNAPNPRTREEQRDLEEKRAKELAELAKRELEELNKEDSKYRRIPWRRVFDKIASYNS